MKEIEKLLARDRAAGVPEPPDVRYTVAAIQRRLAPERPRRAPDWLIATGAAGVLLGCAGLAVLLGLHPLWLGVIPLSVLSLCPILLRKGA